MIQMSGVPSDCHGNTCWVAMQPILFRFGIWQLSSGRQDRWAAAEFLGAVTEVVSSCAGRVQGLRMTVQWQLHSTKVSMLPRALHTSASCLPSHQHILPLQAVTAPLPASFRGREGCRMARHALRLFAAPDIVCSARHCATQKCTGTHLMEWQMWCRRHRPFHAWSRRRRLSRLGDCCRLRSWHGPSNGHCGSSCDVHSLGAMSSASWSYACMSASARQRCSKLSSSSLLGCACAAACCRSTLPAWPK